VNIEAYAQELSLYGAGMTEDGEIIGTRGQPTGVVTTEKKGRLRFENKSTGRLIASYPAKPGSISAFVESFWFWNKA
jgi:hypothetical protein